MKRLKILVSAFAVSPNRGSEFGVGWNVVTRLAKYHDVTVLYGDIGRDDRSRREIEQWISENGLIGGLTFRYVDQSWLGLFFLKLTHHIKPFVFIYYWAYRCWQKQAYFTAMDLLSHERFDATHLITFIGYRDPGYLWKLPIPFFWGPINGADNIPWAYFPILSFDAKVRYFVRNTINLIQRKGSRNVRRAAQKASKIWVVTDKDFQMVFRQWGVVAKHLPETGLSLSDREIKPRRYNPDKPLRIVWSGLLEGRKALPLLLSAIAQLEDRNRLRLTVLGDGPEKAQWMSIAEELQINHLVDWKGRLPLQEAQTCMAESDIFVFTSIKEASSTVVLEALACGLPVVCHDACGMAAVIDGDCGIKIPMKNPKQSIQGFVSAIRSFLDAPELVEKLSSGALDRAKELTWDKKVEEIAMAYGAMNKRIDI